MAYVSIEQRLAAIESGLDLAVNTPAAADLLLPFGYDEQKLNGGLELLADAVNLANRQKVEYGEQYEATEAVKEAWAAAKTAYGQSLALARVALKNDTAAQTALGLTGRRKKTLAGWIDQATTFYNNLLNDAGWVATMANFNRTEPTLQNERGLVQALVQANNSQEKEKGESKAATRERDQKLDELYDWYGDYRDVAIVALDGHPEWIELIRKGEVD